MAVITNQELRDLWADAAKIKEAISNGKLVVTDPDVLNVLENSTLSVKASDTDAELALIKSELEGIKDRLDDPLLVKQTGSKVGTEIVLFNSVAITTTGYLFSTDYGGGFKLNNNSEYAFICRNTLDSPVRVLLYADYFGASRAVRYTDGDKIVSEIVIPSVGDQRYLVNKENFPPLGIFGGEQTNFRAVIQALELPTSGSFSMMLIGRG